MTADAPPLRVAIIGGGPAGLGAAILFARLPFVDWALYEKKPAISETGGGLSLQRHTWRMLEELGVAESITTRDFARPADGSSGQHRNGRSGVLLKKSFFSDDTPPHQQSARVVRATLQAALLAKVDQSRVHTGKRLVSIVQLPSMKVRIEFEDGLVDEVDLLVGADGIRSAVRQSAFPAHTVSYIGQSAYRTIIRTSTAALINGLPMAPIFWHNLGGKYVFTCPLGGDAFEVTARIRPPPSSDQVSWGRPFDFGLLIDQYAEFCPPVRQVLKEVVAQGGTQEFAMFSGPRLERVEAWDALALVGDASHPLSGAFGAGAGFALEDVYALAKTVEWAWTKGKGLGEGLRLFDEIRGPHYEGLYGVLDRLGAKHSEIGQRGLGVDEEIETRVRETWEDRDDWMYGYRVDEVVRERLAEEEGRGLRIAELGEGIGDGNRKAGEVNVEVSEVINGVKDVQLGPDA